jgi:protein-disulfide isomerase
MHPTNPGYPSYPSGAPQQPSPSPSQPRTPPSAPQNPSFAPKAKKSSNAIVWIVAGVGCAGLCGLGAFAIILGIYVGYQQQQERAEVERLLADDPYGAPSWDPDYGYPSNTGVNDPSAYGTQPDPLGANPYVDPFAAPAPIPEPLPEPDPIHRVPIGTSPRLGPDDALVTVVVFSDFQCPFCSRLTPTFERLRGQYGSDLRIVFKNNPLPFHTDAMPAAELAMEAYAQNGHTGFWEAHDMLFENQRSLSRSDLEAYGRRLGLSAAQVRRALDMHTHQSEIDADMALARSVDATGTPISYVNGRQLRGAQPYETFVTTIDEEMSRARALVATGIPRSMVYEMAIAR